MGTPCFLCNVVPFDFDDADPDVGAGERMV